MCLRGKTIIGRHERANLGEQSKERRGSRPSVGPINQRKIFVGTRADDGRPEGPPGEPLDDEAAAQGWMPSEPNDGPMNQSLSSLYDLGEADRDLFAAEPASPLAGPGLDESDIQGSTRTPTELVDEEMFGDVARILEGG